MSKLRKKLRGYLDCVPESTLMALKPLLTLLADDAIVIETDLTDEEKEATRQGREEDDVVIPEDLAAHVSSR